MREQLERFVEHLTEQVRASPHTIKAYRRDVAQFLDTVEEVTGREPPSGSLPSRSGQNVPYPPRDG